MADIKKDIRGTQTEKNLVNAYVSESTAYSRYTFYGKQATKENYFGIGRVFDETATNELNHAKVFFKYLQGGSVNCNINIDAGEILDTASNLETAAREEKCEGVEQYLKAAKTADEEGFAEIADHFRAIAEVEGHHEIRFRTLLEQVQQDTVWKREKPIKWMCTVCGYIYEGTEPPAVCPACYHPYQHYIPDPETYTR